MGFIPQKNYTHSANFGQNNPSKSKTSYWQQEVEVSIPPKPKGMGNLETRFMIKEQELRQILMENSDEESLVILKEKTQLNLKIGTILNLRKQLNIKKSGGRKPILSQILGEELTDIPQIKEEPSQPPKPSPIQEEKQIDPNTIPFEEFFKLPRDKKIELFNQMDLYKRKEINELIRLRKQQNAKPENINQRIG